MTEWNIQTRAHACQACGKAFEDKQSFHTLLFEEPVGLNRSDLCEECWRTQYGEGGRDRKGFISYWQGVYEAPPPPTEVIQKQTAESLLRKLMELKDPAYIPAAYILAVMLERKRILKVREQLKKDGQRFFVYEHPQSGDIFTVLDPVLQLNQLAQVQKDVANLLEHGLPVAPATEAGIPSPAGTEAAGTPATSPATTTEQTPTAG
jgi:hypothetical protein